MNCFEETAIKNRKLPEPWKSQTALDELASFLQQNWEQRAALFTDGEVTSRQQYLGFTGQGGIRTNHYVGTIVFKGQQLNIFPKVFREEKDDHDVGELDLHHLMKNLVQWLQYCTRIDYPFISIKGQLEDSEDLKELFITLYLHYVKRTLEHGQFYQYVEKTEDLGVVKGCINFRDYICRKIPNGMGNYFRCSFSNFEFDNRVNRIMKYTCRSLINNTESAANKKLIRHILIQLSDVADVKCTPADCDGIRLSKLHRQYGVIMSMSKMFLLNQTTAYQIDHHQSFCFLFPTELLFEGFVGGFIQETLRSEAAVRLQASELTLINDVYYQGQSLGKAFTMRHDILVEHHQYGMFVLDTKYKQLSRFEGNPDVKKSVTEEVSQSDLYQIIEYAAHRDIERAYLLYPMYRYEEEEPTDVVLERKSTLGKKILVHIVRLPFVFEEDVQSLKNSLRHAIYEIFS